MNFDAQQSSVDKLSDVFKQISVSDLLALKTAGVRANQSLIISRIGKVTSIISNNKVSVEWIPDRGEKLAGAHVKALHLITDETTIYDFFRKRLSQMWFIINMKPMLFS